jgi:malate dehydrogenase (oxaloacetate-decarboxylating)
VTLALIGAGAANVAISRLLFKSGVRPENAMVVDSKGILHPGRQDLELRKTEFVDKWRLCLTTNKQGRTGDIADALRGTDVCIALSTPGPDIIRKEWVAQMAKDSIVFACANPIPEMWPWDAKEAGARVVATGRSDFPNQVNNSLGFPGIFRGALDVRARTISDEMCIAAAEEMALCAEEKGLTPDYIAPTMDEWALFPREAVAVGMKAIEQGLARRTVDRSQLYDHAVHIIERARELNRMMMRDGFIAEAPED